MNDSERLKEIADFVRSIPYPLQDVDAEDNIIEENSPANLAKYLDDFADRVRSKPGNLLLIETATQWAINASRIVSAGDDHYEVQADEWEAALEQFIQ